MSEDQRICLLLAELPTLGKLQKMREISELLFDGGEDSEYANDDCVQIKNCSAVSQFEKGHNIIPPPPSSSNPPSLNTMPKGRINPEFLLNNHINNPNV